MTTTKTVTLSVASQLDNDTRSILSGIGAAERKADALTTSYNDGCIAFLAWLRSRNYTPDHLVGGKSELFREVKAAFAEGYFAAADLRTWQAGPHAKGTDGEKLDKRLGQKIARMVTHMNLFKSAAAADPNGEVVYSATGKPMPAIVANAKGSGGGRGKNKPLSESLMDAIDTLIKRVRTDGTKETPTLNGHGELVAALLRARDLVK